MAEPRGTWLWTLLRKQKRPQLDKIEQDLVKGASEKREFAGDPNQAEHMRIKLRKH
jgi:hypothetical protein